MQNCGTCAWSNVMEMSQGEVTEVRCNHPTVELMRMSEEVPDWIIDKNTFRPSAGQDCSTWRSKRNAAPVTA